MIHKGSCHCGKTEFTAEGKIEQVLECNCSYCSRKGFLLWFVPRDKFKYSAPDDGLKQYFFNKHAIEHLFCKECGVECFGFAKDPSSGAEIVGVNARCITDIDLNSLKRIPHDGKSV